MERTKPAGNDLKDPNTPDEGDDYSPVYAYDYNNHANEISEKKYNWESISDFEQDQLSTSAEVMQFYCLRRRLSEWRLQEPIYIYVK